MPDIKATTGGVIVTPLGYDGSDLQNLATDTDGHLQVDTLTSALPTGAATETTLTLCRIALDVIATLTDALHANGYDQFDVNVLSSVLPTGAATEGKQDTMITALQLIDDLRAALASVAGDQLRADVISSALPSGAATEGKQDTMITALQLIDDLRNALATVATDKLRTSVIDSALPSGAASETTLGTINTYLSKYPNWRYQGDQLVNVVGSVAVSSATWTTLASYTVPTGVKAYIVGWSGSIYYANTLYSVALDVGGSIRSYADSVNLPVIFQGTTLLTASAGQVVRVQGYHSVGTAQFMKGWINGWYETA